MLTTQAGQNIAQNIVTDVNANLVSPEPNSRKVLSPEAALLFDKSIVARPLMVPEVCSLHVKNTEYRYRWVFTGHGGQMYTMRKAQGFVNATIEDVDVLNGNTVADTGEIRSGDLILMKIRADLYDAHMKWNMQKASILQRSRGMYLKGASSDVFSDETPTRQTVAQEPGARTGKATPFIPENPDMFVSQSESSGRAEAARETINEIRTKIEADAAAKAEKARKEA